MKAFVIDVDGCLTDGQMWYSAEGKMFKAFGADDHDALKLIKDKIWTVFVTADDLGYNITWKRVYEDMKFNCALVKMEDRIRWIGQEYGLSETIYMGDGILDGGIFEEVGYSI